MYGKTWILTVINNWKFIKTFDSEENGPEQKKVLASWKGYIAEYYSVKQMKAAI